MVAHSVTRAGPEIEALLLFGVVRGLTWEVELSSTFGGGGEEGGPFSPGRVSDRTDEDLSTDSPSDIVGLLFVPGGEQIDDGEDI